MVLKDRKAVVIVTLHYTNKYTGFFYAGLRWDLSIFGAQSVPIYRMPSRGITHCEITLLGGHTDPLKRSGASQF